MRAWNGLVSDEELRGVAAQHHAGESLLAIATRHWRRWGYTTPETAAQVLARGLRANGFAVRGPGAAVRLHRAKSGYAAISATELRHAAAEHAAGWSLRSIAARKWRESGYASPQSARAALGVALHKRGFTVRDNREAVLQGNITHGYSRYKSPSHLKHGQYLAYKRAQRAARLDASTSHS